MRTFEEWKYSFIVYVVMQIDFSWSSPNVILDAYAIVKSSQNELSNCCITFASEYSKMMKPCQS
jgi:hypothetical protein